LFLVQSILWVYWVSLADSVMGFPLFDNREEKETFLLVVGLLATRSISLAKGAEFMDMSLMEFSAVLRSIGVAYSYLDMDEALHEIEAAKRLADRLEF
jgi:predicted HTH domain antitoxin